MYVIWCDDEFGIQTRMAKVKMAKVFFVLFFQNGETFFSEVQQWQNFIFDQLIDFGHEKRIAQNYDLLLSILVLS
jgi:hypothetical protein